MLMLEDDWSGDACFKRRLEGGCVGHMGCVLIVGDWLDVGDLVLHLSMTHIDLLVFYLCNHLPEYPV